MEMSKGASRYCFYLQNFLTLLSPIRLSQHKKTRLLVLYSKLTCCYCWNAEYLSLTILPLLLDCLTYVLIQDAGALWTQRSWTVYLQTAKDNKFITQKSANPHAIYIISVHVFKTNNNNDFISSTMISKPGGGYFGWGCAAGTLESLAYTRDSSAEFCYPILV